MSRSAVDWRSSGTINYKEFCVNYPQIKISIKQWKSILYGFSKEFKFYILETGNKAKLPFGLGTFAIEKKKRKHYKVTPDGKQYINLPIDWVKTKEKGKIIYNFNYHTEGYYFGWKWFRPRGTFTLCDLWDFKPSRVSSRLLAYYINSDNKYAQLYKEWRLVNKG